MGAIIYSLESAKYYTSVDGTDIVYFADDQDNLYDFSRCTNITAMLTVTAYTGGATSLDIDIQTSPFDSTVTADWVEVISFTQITGTTKEIKTTTNGVMRYLRAVYTWVGGSAPTWTGFIQIKQTGIGYPL